MSSFGYSGRCEGGPKDGERLEHSRKVYICSGGYYRLIDGVTSALSFWLWSEV